MKKLTLALLIPLSLPSAMNASAQAGAGRQTGKPQQQQQKKVSLGEFQQQQASTTASAGAAPYQCPQGEKPVTKQPLATTAGAADDAMYKSLPAIDGLTSEQGSTNSSEQNAPMAHNTPTQQLAYLLVGQQVNTVLQNNRIFPTKDAGARTTKHGYTFNLHDTTSLHNGIRRHSDYGRLAARWTSLTTGMLNDPNISTVKSDEELTSLRAKIASLATTVFAAPQFPEEPQISSATALRAYKNSPLLTALQQEFSARDLVTQQEVDTFATAVELPVTKAVELYKTAENANVLKQRFSNNFAPTQEGQLTETIRPADMQAFATHVENFQTTVAELTKNQTPLDSVVCHGADIFQDPITGDKMNFGQVNVDGAAATNLLQLANATAMTALSSGRLATLKDDKETIKTRLGVVDKELAALTDRIQFHSKDPKATKEVLTLKRQAAELQTEKAGLTQLIDNMTLARAFQKDLLLQLGANTETPVEKIPTITWVQASSWNFFTGVKLPEKTTENAYQARERIAVKAATEHCKGIESAKYASALRLLLNNDDFRAYVHEKDVTERAHQAAAAELALANKK